MPNRHLLPWLSLGIALLAPPAPEAAAQTVVRLCFINSSGIVAQSRMIYLDWQGTEHTSAWVQTALGQQHCETKQDLQALRFEVRSALGAAFGSREIFCTRDADPRRSANLTLAGTAFNISCTVGQ